MSNKLWTKQWLRYVKSRQSSSNKLYWEKKVKNYHTSQLELSKRIWTMKYWVSDMSKYKSSVTQHTPPCNSKVCSQCGKMPTHDFQYHPTKTVVCCKCNKCGHFQVVCRSKKTDKVQQIVDKNDEDYFLNSYRIKSKSLKNPGRLLYNSMVY